MTSTQTTDSQIHDFAIAAANAGDEDMRRDCLKALAGSPAARLRVEGIIAQAAAWAADMDTDYDNWYD